MAIELNEAIPQVSGLTVYSQVHDPLFGEDPPPSPGPEPALLCLFDAQTLFKSYLYLKLGDVPIIAQVQMGQVFIAQGQAN